MREDIQENKTLAASSETQYWLRTRQLVARWRKVYASIDEFEDPIGFAMWMLDRRSEFGSATWRAYKAAVIWALENRCCDFFGEVSQEAADVAPRFLEEVGQHGLVSSSDRTSGLKARRVPDSDRLKLEAHFARSKSKFAPYVPLMVRVGVLAGLRPIEWCTAHLFLGTGDCAAILIVENAKHTNGRGHGQFRTVIWEELPKDIIDDLVRWLEFVAVSVAGATRPDLAWNKTMKALARELYRANKKLWPRRKRHVAPYSARQEYSARIKTLHDPEFVAALMGHAVDDTAYRHYAGIHKFGSFSVYPNLPNAHPAEVAKVRRTGWRDKLESIASVIQKPPKIR